MKKSCFLLLVLISLSCNNKDNVEQTKTQSAFILPDSIDPIKVIAVYKEDFANIILVYNSLEKKGARKITYRPGFPVFTDSLLVKGANEFRSLKYTTTYMVNDTSVTSVYDLKVIHPSSNWQGQTPGKEPIITVFRRIDK